MISRYIAWDYTCQNNQLQFQSDRILYTYAVIASHRFKYFYTRSNEYTPVNGQDSCQEYNWLGIMNRHCSYIISFIQIFQQLKPWARCRSERDVNSQSSRVIVLRHLNGNYDLNDKTFFFLLCARMASTEEVKQIWKNADCVCFDVDSTVVMDEGIDELANFLGKGEEVSRMWVPVYCRCAAMIFYLVMLPFDELM